MLRRPHAHLVSGRIYRCEASGSVLSQRSPDGFVASGRIDEFIATGSLCVLRASGRIYGVRTD